MNSIQFPDGMKVPVLGQGTWKFGEGERDEAEEVAALRAGLEMGMTLIDTAEMYGEGAAEKIVGRAIEGMRDRVFLGTRGINLGDADAVMIQLAAEADAWIYGRGEEAVTKEGTLRPQTFY